MQINAYYAFGGIERAIDLGVSHPARKWPLKFELRTITF